MPCVPKDAGDLWIAKSIRLVSLGAIVGILVSFGHGLLSGMPMWEGPPRALVAELGVLAFVLGLSRRGFAQPAAQLLAASLPLFATTLMVMSGHGFRDVAALMFPASLVLCGLLLDRRTLVAITVLTVLCMTGVLFAEAHGLLGPPANPVDPYADIADAAIILVVTSLGVGMVAGRLRDSHARLRRQEAELRTSEARYRGLVELAADAIVVGRPGEGLIEVNHRASELTGYAGRDLLGRTLESLFRPTQRQRAPFCHDLVEPGQIVVAERILTRRDGRTVPVEMSSTRMPDGSCQAILRDVSERRRAEAERAALEIRLRQSQKMEAVGRLAGGVAHDFNNLLTAITGSLTLAQRDVPLVVLGVSDTGHGMTEQVRSRIFEPFYTTKPAGSGTGLGLAMAYGAVEQNGGWIDVASQPGQGATFRIFLPPARGDGAVAPTPATEAPRGSETVLLVEDEDAVREITTVHRIRRRGHLPPRRARSRGASRREALRPSGPGRGRPHRPRRIG